jgi:hypothetical protein
MVLIPSFIAVIAPLRPGFKGEARHFLYAGIHLDHFIFIFDSSLHFALSE